MIPSNKLQILPVRSRLVVLALLAVLLGTSLGFAQGFGKNKVQYSDFDWRYLQSEHFDVYYSDGQYRIAEFTAETAEKALIEIQNSWDYELEGRITFIIYSSHNRFQQTNVSSQQPEESVGGFTEFLKNRVVLPYTGNYEAFRHVIHHELTHAVNLRMFYGTGFQSILIGTATSDIPLWFTEGLAEYESRGGWDVDADMFMRDATITGYLPPIDYLNGYFAYKGGQSVFYYLDRKYGKQKVGEFVNKVKRSRDVERSIKSAIGLEMEELDRRWQNWLRKIYWPTIADMNSPRDFAERLTDHSKLHNYVNNGAAISPNGEDVVFLSDRSDYFDIWHLDMDKKKFHKLLRGQRSQDFEQLKWLDARISWSPDGKNITFASKAGASDAVNILNVRKKKVTDRLRFDLDGVFNPVWSPDGNRIAFVGMKLGQSDLYYYELGPKQLVQVTNDVFSDDDPVWQNDSNTLIFSSDRGDSVRVNGYSPEFQVWDVDYSTSNLYRIAVGKDFAERLTFDEGANEKTPTVSPDGRFVIYVSDKSGLNNLYRYDFESGTNEAITNALTGCYLPSYSHAADRLVFTSFYEGGYDVYLLKNPAGMEAVEPDITNFRRHGTPDPEVERISAADIESEQISVSESSRQYARHVFAREKSMDADMTEKALADTHTTRKPGGGFFSKKYRVKFTPDFVYATAAYSSFFGAQGSGQILFSDVLGDQLILVTTDLYYDFNNIDNSNFSAQYFYLPHRINYGLGLFRYVYYLDSGNIRDQTVQVQLDLAYPFSRFSRMEMIVGGYGIDRSEWFEYDDNQVRLGDYKRIARRRVLLPELAYVHDTVVWGSTGPVNGARYRISYAYSPPIGTNGVVNKPYAEFYTVKGDVRHYIKIGRDYSWATRFTAGLSDGPKPQHFFLGGVSNWINRRFENNEVPTDEINDFYFSSFITPFRGGDYFEKRGTGNRFFLTNQEFRFPMVRYLILGWPLPIALQNIRGALFTDVGAAWNDNVFKFTERDRDENGDRTGTRRLSDAQVAYGIGTRMNLGFFLLRWDVAWSTDGVDTSKPRYFFSLGAEY